MKSTAARGTLLPVRLTESEKKIFEAAARESGLPVSTWLRVAGLDRARYQIRKTKKED